ncbi:MAG: glycosyltransferase, partial [Gemmobacter sp.]|nr:glycosyltransferase [Gemmobacter sp.]
TLADVLVLPSKSEPWGLVVNEAMICGLPVVVSDKCGSAIDLVQDGKTGFSFDYTNERKLASYIIKIYKRRS